MVIKAWRVGGSGWVTNNWDCWPWDVWGVQDELYKGSLNLILQLGYYFDVPADVPGEKVGNKHGVDYFLTPIRGRCVMENVVNNGWFDGFIVRKPDEPADIRHMVEIVAPFIEGLSPCLKEPFEIDGPVKSLV